MISDLESEVRWYAVLGFIEAVLVAVLSPVAVALGSLL